MENRNGLVVDARVTEANGTAERDAAMGMTMKISSEHCRKTLGGDKGYDTKDFVAVCGALNLTAHVAQNTCDGESAIDERTTRHAGYEVSQKKRKLVEEVFGWLKAVGPMRRPHFRGLTDCRY